MRLLGVPETLRRSVRFQDMGYAVHDLRDLLSLARMLRGFSEEHAHDNNHDLFLNTAVALEARAHFMATTDNLMGLERDTAIHAPVNLLV